MATDIFDSRQTTTLRIDVTQEDDLDYWSERFRVSREKLESTVKRIGPLVRDVEEHLHGHR
jgi:hypothetical protein